MLRAGAETDTPLRIMFPMISSLDELHEAKEVVRESIELLTQQGIEHNAAPSLGMMVELPAAAELAEEFAREVDFFSIGTNDLIQFMLATDRTNEAVADFYLPHHPAVLRTLNRIARAALKHNCELSLCGDMAHQTQYMPFLLGIGIRTFSVDPIFLLRTQQAIKATSVKDAEALAQAMLSKSRICEIAALLPTPPASAAQ